MMMDSSCTETAKTQSDGEISDMSLGLASDLAECGNRETCDVPRSNIQQVIDCVLSSSPRTSKVTEQNKVDVDTEVRKASEVELQTNEYAEAGAANLETDLNVEKKGHTTNSEPTDLPAADTVQGSQSHGSWPPPSNPFLRVTGSSVDGGASAAPIVMSSSLFARTLSPMDISDGSPMSTSATSDVIGYSKLRESAPSSLCSASPYESPTHAASGTVDSAADVAGVRPDSLYLSRSILQERERQWLAKKGSYSSLSECESSPTGSMDALIEAAKNTPLDTQGTVSMEGDMITFVADGINELIKRSRGGKTVQCKTKTKYIFC